MNRKKSGCSCLCLILALVIAGLWRLWNTMEVPEAGEYAAADRAILAFADENGLSLGDYGEGK